ncbi:MAG: hypothetical protein PVF37_18660, partial [Desulfobacterales bacterium]
LCSFTRAGAAGQKAASLIKERNSNKTNVECRIKELQLFYSLKKAERSDIHHSSIFNRPSSFQVSYEVSGANN